MNGQGKARAWILGGLFWFFTTTLCGQDVLTPETVVDLQRVGDVAMDPAGEVVVYTLSRQRAPEDDPGRRYSELWLAPVGEGKPRPFSASKGHVQAPAFSPDGGRITFLDKREGQHEETQIYALARDGGEARPLTRHDASISLYRWSPDGRWIAFVDKESETKEEKEEKKKGRDWKVFGEGERARRLWLFDVETEEERRLSDAGLHVWDVVWTPDSRGLIFQATDVPRTDESYLDRKIYLQALPEGEAAPLTPTPGKLATMAVSPDGLHLAFLGATSRNDPIAQSVFLVPLGGPGAGRSRLLTEGYEGSVQNLRWLDDETLLIQSAEGERTPLYRLDAKTGKRQTVSWGRQVISQMDLRPGGGPLALAAHAAEHPPELFVVPELGGEARRKSHHNPELEGVRFARQEVVTWKGADGWEIGGVLTYPLDYTAGRAYPLVLQIHGGPEGVSLDGWRTSAQYPVQLLARDGFFVLEPNYRGSGGRGVEFSKADHDDLAGKEFEDVLAGIDSLVDRGLVDPQRVGTGGWSYGGYFSAWAATRHSPRFQAAVVCAGLINWISFTGTTDIPNEMSIVHWNQWWFDNPELHWQRSPLAHLDKTRTPTLLVHGEKDERVHPEQSLELHTALRLKGVPTGLVLYPREPHGVFERAHQLDFMERTLGWFRQYLGAAAQGTPSGR